MSSRALRKQVAQALKSAGLSNRLYHGNKRIVYKYYDGQYLRDLLYMLSLKPGMLVNDCDALNHRVKGPINYGFIKWYKTTYIFQLDQVEFEDGRWSCGCPGGPRPAWTREQIEKYMLLTDEEIARSKADGWWSDLAQKRQNALRAGQHICDENGILLPEFATNE